MKKLLFAHLGTRFPYENYGLHETINLRGNSEIYIANCVANGTMFYSRRKLRKGLNRNKNHYSFKDFY